MTRPQEMQPAIFDDLEPDACEYCDERNRRDRRHHPTAQRHRTEREVRMNTFARIATESEFAWRTETCNTCDNHGYDCYDCRGEGSWNASCADCRNEKPLNSDGLCAECAALDAVLDITVKTLGGERSEIWL